VRIAALDPPALLVDGFPVELRRVPTPSQLERTLAVTQSVEREIGKAEPAERLMGLACLAALYDDAASDFALTSEHDLSKAAAEKHKRAVDEGAKQLAAVDWGAPEGRAILGKLSARFGGRAWVLLVLPGGDAPVLQLASGAEQDSWGRIAALAALMVAPSTRVAATSIVAGLPRRAQIDVMHEIFHAHDHLRPWASSYALEGAPDGELARAYRVFRALAWGLWEGARPQEEVLASLLRGAAAAQLDRAWVAAFLEYYGKNMLALHQHREDGPDLARAFQQWLLAHGYTDVDVYAQAIAAAQDL
jgi:hypothetical protein